METNKPKNTERDWAALAREGHGKIIGGSKVPKNLVYVGQGSNPSIGNLLNLDNDSLYSTWDDFKWKGWNGNALKDHYAIEISAWEKATGLNYKTVIKFKENRGSTGDSSPVNTERDWAQLAKDGLAKANPGYVGVGVGMMPSLQRQFGAGNISILGESSKIRGGAYTENQYQTPIENWEKVTGLDYLEVIGAPKEKEMKKSYYTKYSPHLKAFVKEILEGKMANFETENGFTGFLFYNEYGGAHGFVSDAAATGVWPDYYEKVTSAEFIARISALPDKKKDFIGTIAGSYPLKITAETVEAGCQQYTKEKILEIAKAVETMRNGIIVENKGFSAVKVTGEGVFVDRNHVTFEAFDYLRVKMEELAK